MVKKGKSLGRSKTTKENISLQTRHKLQTTKDVLVRARTDYHKTDEDETNKNKQISTRQLTQTPVPKEKYCKMLCTDKIQIGNAYSLLKLPHLIW